MAKTVAVIQHVAFEDLGTLEPILNNLGFAIQYYQAGYDDLRKIPAQSDLLVVLGGPIGVYDAQAYPFLEDELALLKTRLEKDLPTLGICLGAQLMAHALGAQVYAGPEKEIGWYPIQVTDDPAYAYFKVLAESPMFHWHGDTFDLPNDCKRLASSALYENQAFVYRQHCFAFQYHPEVYAKALEKWYIGHSCEIHHTPQVTTAKLRKAAQQYADTLEKNAADFWRQWLTQIGFV